MNSYPNNLYTLKQKELVSIIIDQDKKIEKYKEKLISEINHRGRVVNNMNEHLDRVIDERDNYSDMLKFLTCNPKKRQEQIDSGCWTESQLAKLNSIIDYNLL